MAIQIRMSPGYENACGGDTVHYSSQSLGHEFRAKTGS
jgi:hypothetical protein